MEYHGNLLSTEFSKKENFKRIEKEVKKLHSYEMPCILEIPIIEINKDYLNWLKKEIK